MKTYLSSFFLVVSLSSLSFVSLAADPVTNDSNQAGYQAQSTNSQPKDGEAIKILMVIDDNEVNAAENAKKKATNPSVKKYAETMDKDHNKNLQETKILMTDLKITPMSSDKSISLEKKGIDELNKLKSLNDKEFDKVYIEDMVNGHKEVLQILDTDLIPKVSNPQLLNHLKATRETVAHHLQSAQEIQSQLK